MTVEHFADRLCLSFDLDWAADFIVDELAQRLAAERLPATIFCTHESAAVARLLALDGIEAALHPNFLGAPRAAEAQTLRQLHRRFPGASGLRSHALYFHSGLLRLLHGAGLSYLSNDLAFLVEGLRPHYDYSGLLRLPIFWEDDVHCAYFNSDGHDAGDDFDLARLALHRPGLKVFNFHPVHLYLNTHDFADYRRAKPVLGDPRAAPSLRQPGPGVGTLFSALCAAATRGTLGTLTTLGAIDREFRQTQPYEGRYAGFLAALAAEQATGDEERSDDPDTKAR